MGVGVGVGVKAGCLKIEVFGRAVVAFLNHVSSSNLSLSQRVSVLLLNQRGFNKRKVSSSILVVFEKIIVILV